VDTLLSAKKVAVSYNLEQIRTALAEVNPSYSNYLDMDTGLVLRINDTDTSADSEELRNQIMEGYGDRYRYIPGGNPAPDDEAIKTWLEAEGL